jgi:hypothetical protein
VQSAYRTDGFAEATARRAALQEELATLGTRHRALIDYGLAVERALAKAKAHAFMLGALAGLVVATIVDLVELWRR